MEVQELEIEKEKVEKELADLKRALKEGIISKKNPLTQDLIAVYDHLQHSGKIIDVFKSFRKVGLGEDDNPKLAIVRADARYCYLYKIQSGGAIFSREKKGWQIYAVKGQGDVKLPPDTFQWEALESDNRRQRCLPPLIPPRINIHISAKILPQYYHIIFEPQTWEKVPLPPRDPILGKMLTPNLFGVIATWDMTDLEMKILEGRA